MRDDVLETGLETPVPVTDVGDPVPVTGYGDVAFERGNGAEDEIPMVGVGLVDPVPGMKGLVPVPLVRAGNVVFG